MAKRTKVTGSLLEKVVRAVKGYLSGDDVSLKDKNGMVDRNLGKALMEAAKELGVNEEGNQVDEEEFIDLTATKFQKLIDISKDKEGKGPSK